MAKDLSGYLAIRLLHGNGPTPPGFISQDQLGPQPGTPSPNSLDYLLLH
jgi:hypothetical protein